MGGEENSPHDEELEHVCLLPCLKTYVRMDRI